MNCSSPIVVVDKDGNTAVVLVPKIAHLNKQYPKDMTRFTEWEFNTILDFKCYVCGKRNPYKNGSDVITKNKKGLTTHISCLPILGYGPVKMFVKSPARSRSIGCMYRFKYKDIIISETFILASNNEIVVIYIDKTMVYGFIEIRESNVFLKQLLSFLKAHKITIGDRKFVMFFF
jgi:hypothetical protein